MVWHRCVMYSTRSNGGGLRAARKTPSWHKTQQGLARAQVLFKDSEPRSSPPKRGVTEDKTGNISRRHAWDLWHPYRFCAVCVFTRAIQSRTCWLGDEESLRNDDFILRIPGPVHHAFTALHGEVDVSHHRHCWKPLDAGHCTSRHTAAGNTHGCLLFQKRWMLSSLFLKKNIYFMPVNVTRFFCCSRAAHANSDVGKTWLALLAMQKQESHFICKTLNVCLCDNINSGEAKGELRLWSANEN